MIFQLEKVKNQTYEWYNKSMMIVEQKNRDLQNYTQTHIWNILEGGVAWRRLGAIFLFPHREYTSVVSDWDDDDDDEKSCVEMNVLSEWVNAPCSNTIGFLLFLLDSGSGFTFFLFSGVLLLLLLFLNKSLWCDRYCRRQESWNCWMKMKWIFILFERESFW